MPRRRRPVQRYLAPQGAVISPLLANLYGYFKAQFALSKDEATRGWQKRALRQD